MEGSNYTNSDEASSPNEIVQLETNEDPEALSALRRPRSIRVVNVHKAYSRGKKILPVLTGVNMRVEHGEIYGLLGPSGSGKTTLINAIAGITKLDAGTIFLYEYQVGDKRCAVPGPNVGYMPQELALFGLFSIRETLQFFGRALGLKISYVNERIDFLIKLLDLPPASRYVRTLSGGQGRRVSFAISILQEPKLVLLDEPTVGVDPLLRERIWEHLLSMSKGNCTIVLTTHYAEETRQAHRVGFLRSGTMMVEDSPEVLISRFNVSTLEDVFLVLATQEGDLDKDEFIQKKKEDATLLRRFSTDSKISLQDIQGEGYLDIKRRKWWDYYKFRRNHVYALVVKHALIHFRNIGFILFSLGLPALQVILFCIAIGADPKYIDIDVVNNDASEEQCKVNETSYYSCWYIEKFKARHERTIISPTLDSAMNDMRKGKVEGVVLIGKNFTKIYQKWIDYKDMPAYELMLGLRDVQIKVTVDETDKQVEYYVRTVVTKAFEDFSRKIAAYVYHTYDADINMTKVQPVLVLKPVYGGGGMTFTDFIAPGVMGSIVYFLALGLTAVAFVTEKSQGLLNRMYVAGINNMEILMGHIITFTLVVVMQIIIVVTCLFLIFEITIVGKLYLVLLLLLIVGIGGMTFGFMLSTVFDTEMTAIQGAFGSFYPLVIISGVVWPLISMTVGWRYFCYFFPLTYPIEALRNILLRGWDITYSGVWLGYVVAAVWAAVFYILSVLVLTIRSR